MERLENDVIRKECCDRAVVRRVEKKRLEMSLWLIVLVDHAKELGSYPRIDTVAHNHP